MAKTRNKAAKKRSVIIPQNPASLLNPVDRLSGTNQNVHWAIMNGHKNRQMNGTTHQ